MFSPLLKTNPPHPTIFRYVSKESHQQKVNCFLAELKKSFLGEKNN